MMAGRVIAVVGPSGAGKDSVIAGIMAQAQAYPQLRRARRVITRPADAGGEDHLCLSPAEFAARAQAGDFALSWQAHGLSYGIPRSIEADLAQGDQILVNLSRAVLGDAGLRFDNLVVLNITARPEVLAARLAARGRENPEDIAARLAREAPLPEGLTTITIDNSGALDHTVRAALAALFPPKA